MKRAQTHFSLGSTDDENTEQVLAEWLQAIEQLSHGYQQVDLLLAVGQSPVFASTQPTGVQLSPQAESDLKQLQRDVCRLLAGLNDHIQETDRFLTTPLVVSQLRQHTVLLVKWNQRIQATLYLLRPSGLTNRFEHN